MSTTQALVVLRKTEFVEGFMRWTITQVAEAVGARAGAGLDPVARLAGVSIDSRTLRAGELFIAIHGPSHDGHDHVGMLCRPERWRRSWPNRRRAI